MSLFAVENAELLALVPGLAEELDTHFTELRAFLLEQHNEDGTHITDDPTTDVASASVAYVTVGNTSSLSAERALVGTANEIDITDGGANGNVSVGLANEPNVATALTLGGVAGSATAARVFTKKVTGIGDNTATDVLTVTVPNANHAATIRLLFLSSNGGSDAFESSRTATGAVVVARVTGLNAVATAATLTHEAIATVAAGATHTLAYGVSAISGAVGAVNTFTVQVTINDSGNTASNQVVVFAEVLNAEASGITVA